MGTLLVSNVTYIISHLPEDGEVTFNAANIRSSSGECLATTSITARNMKGSSLPSDDITFSK